MDVLKRARRRSFVVFRYFVFVCVMEDFILWFNVCGIDILCVDFCVDFYMCVCVVVCVFMVKIKVGEVVVRVFFIVCFGMMGLCCGYVMCLFDDGDVGSLK